MNWSSFYRFNISETSAGAANYLHDISNLFIAKVFNECGDDCNEASSEKHVLVRLVVLHSNETEINWNTDESYRLDVITSGMCVFSFIQFTVFVEC